MVVRFSSDDSTLRTVIVLTYIQRPTDDGNPMICDITNDDNGASSSIMLWWNANDLEGMVVAMTFVIYFFSIDRESVILGIVLMKFWISGKCFGYNRAFM